MMFSNTTSYIEYEFYKTREKLEIHNHNMHNQNILKHTNAKEGDKAYINDMEYIYTQNDWKSIGHTRYANILNLIVDVPKFKDLRNYRGVGNHHSRQSFQEYLDKIEDSYNKSDCSNDQLNIYKDIIEVLYDKYIK